MNKKTHQNLVENDLIFATLDEAISCCEKEGLLYDRNFYCHRTGNFKERLAIVMVGKDACEVIQYTLRDSECQVIVFQRELIINQEVLDNPSLEGKYFEPRTEPLSLKNVIRRLGDEVYQNKTSSC